MVMLTKPHAALEAFSISAFQFLVWVVGTGAFSISVFGVWQRPPQATCNRLVGVWQRPPQAACKSISVVAFPLHRTNGECFSIDEYIAESPGLESCSPIARPQYGFSVSLDS